METTNGPFKQLGRKPVANVASDEVVVHIELDENGEIPSGAQIVDEERASEGAHYEVRVRVFDSERNVL
jgi:hypothetical protein